MARIKILTSAANPLLKKLRRAVAGGGRTADGYCVAESFHLLEEALKSGCEIAAVLVSDIAYPALESRFGTLRGLRVVSMPDSLFRTVAATETSQGVMALVRPPLWEPRQLFGPRALVVVLDGLQEPGNAGAVVRAAEAFAASGVIFLKGTVSPYNPKAVRASAGSVFRVPLVSGLEAEEAQAAFQRAELEVWCATPAGGANLEDADLRRRCAIIIGSEAHGVSERLRSGSRKIRIPTSSVESLNAAVAAGVLLYEASRQRRSPASR